MMLIVQILLLLILSFFTLAAEEKESQWWKKIPNWNQVLKNVSACQDDATKEIFEIGIWQTCYPIPYHLKEYAMSEFGDDGKDYRKTTVGCFKQFIEADRKSLWTIDYGIQAADCYRSTMGAYDQMGAAQLEAAFAYIPNSMRQILVQKCSGNLTIFNYTHCLNENFTELREQLGDIFSGGRKHKGVETLEDLLKIIDNADVKEEFKILRDALFQKCGSREAISMACVIELQIDLANSQTALDEGLLQAVGVEAMYKECNKIGYHCLKTKPSECNWRDPETRKNCQCTESTNRCTADLYPSLSNFDPDQIEYAGVFAPSSGGVSDSQKNSESGNDKALAKARSEAQKKFGKKRVDSCRCRFDTDYFAATAECEKKYKLEVDKINKSKKSADELQIQCLTYDPSKDVNRQIEEAKKDDARRLAKENTQAVKEGVLDPPPVSPITSENKSDFTPLNSHDASMYQGSGSLPECDEFIPSEFCGTGGRYDYRAYELDEDKFTRLEHGIDFGKYYKKVGVDANKVGIPDLGEHLNGVYQHVTPFLKDDLVNFMGDLFIEKYLQMAYLNLPEQDNETFLERVSDLKKAVKDAGCYKNELEDGGISGEKRVDQMKDDLLGLVDHLGSTDSTTKKKRQYQNNMAHAAQCGQAILNRLKNLQEKLGFDVTMYKTIIDNEKVEELDPITRTIVNTVTNLPGIRHALREMPLATGIVDYAKRPCSLFAIRHGSPLDVNDSGQNIDYDSQNSKRSAYAPKKDGDGWVHCDKGTRNNCKDFKFAVSRSTYCEAVSHEYQMMAEEFSAIHAAYPLLGEKFGTFGGTIVKESAREVIALTAGGIDPRIKDYKLKFERPEGSEKLQQKSCMMHFQKSPHLSELEDAPREKLALVDEHVRARTDKTLADLRKEIKNLCKDKDDKLDQIVKDPKFMGLYFNCDRTKFGLIAQTFLQEEELVPSHATEQLDAVELAHAEQAHAEKLATLDQGIVARTQAVSKKDCLRKKDSSWAVCEWNRRVKVDDKKKALMGNMLQLVFDLATPFMVSKGLPALSQIATRKGVLKLAAGALVGYGTGSYISQVLVGNPTIKAETDVAAYQAGIKSDQEEYEDALKQLERYEKYNPHEQAGEEGALTGIWGASLLSKKPTSLKRARSVRDNLRKIVDEEAVAGTTDSLITQRSKALAQADELLKELFPESLHADILKKPAGAKIKLLEHFVDEADSGLGKKVLAQGKKATISNTPDAVVASADTSSVSPTKSAAVLKAEKNLHKANARHAKIYTKLQSTKGKLTAKSRGKLMKKFRDVEDQQIKAAKEILDARGVKYVEETLVFPLAGSNTTLRVLRFLPTEKGKKGNFLNDLAAGSEDNLNKLDIVFAPSAMEPGAAAYHYTGWGRNVLVVATNNITDPDGVDFFLGHELRHAKTKQRMVQGQPSYYHGRLHILTQDAGAKGFGKKLSIYRNGFSLDELNTFGREDIGANVQRLKSALKKREKIAEEISKNKRNKVTNKKKIAKDKKARADINKEILRYQSRIKQAADLGMGMSDALIEQVTLIKDNLDTGKVQVKLDLATGEVTYTFTEGNKSFRLSIPASKLDNIPDMPAFYKGELEKLLEFAEKNKRYFEDAESINAIMRAKVADSEKIRLIGIEQKDLSRKLKLEDAVVRKNSKSGQKNKSEKKNGPDGEDGPPKKEEPQPDDGVIELSDADLEALDDVADVPDNPSAAVRPEFLRESRGRLIEKLRQKLGDAEAKRRFPCLF